MSDTQSAAPEMTRPIPPPPRSWTRHLSGFLVIAVLVLLVGAVSLTIQRLRTGTVEADLAREIAAMKSDVEAMNARVAMLESASSETQSSIAQLADLAMRLGAIEGDVAHAADRDALAQLQDRIARLENRSPNEMLKLAAATLARANLARATESGTPFRAELDALRTVAPDDAALGLLQSAADSGVPTRPFLTARFADAARAALDAERNGQTGSNFAARLWASMRRLVTVRRVGDVDGTTTEDRIARAQAACDRGDLAGAVLEVRDLGGAAAGPLESWFKDAETRLVVDSAMADMTARIVQALTAPPATLASPQGRP
jgi:hypothetical protein